MQRQDDPTTAARYLVDADELRAVYREAFLTGLERLREAGELKIEGDFAHLQSDEAWQDFTGALESTDWVSHIEPPPQAHSSAEHVLKYLARFLSGGRSATPASPRRTKTT